MRKSKLAVFFLLLLLMIFLTGCGAEEALADLVDALFDIKQAASLPFNLDPLAELLSYLRPLALLAVVAFGGASLQSYFRGENVKEAILSRHIKWFGVLVLLGTPPSFFNFIHQTGQGYWPNGLTTSFVAEKMGILSLALGTGPLAVIKFLFVLVAFVALVVAVASQVVIEALVLVGYPAAVVLCIGFRSLRMILCWFITFVTWILFAPIWYRALQLIGDGGGLVSPVVFAFLTFVCVIAQWVIPLVATVTLLYQEIVAIIPQIPIGSSGLLDFVQTVALLGRRNGIGGTSSRSGARTGANSPSSVVDADWEEVPKTPQLRNPAPIAGLLGPGTEPGEEPPSTSQGPQSGPQGTGEDSEAEPGSPPTKGAPKGEKGGAADDSDSKNTGFLAGWVGGSVGVDDQSTPPRVRELETEESPPDDQDEREEPPGESPEGVRAEDREAPPKLRQVTDRLRDETARAIEEKAELAQTAGTIITPVAPEAGVPLTVGGAAAKKAADRVQSGSKTGPPQRRADKGGTAKTGEHSKTRQVPQVPATKRSQPLQSSGKQKAKPRQRTETGSRSQRTQPKTDSTQPVEQTRQPQLRPRQRQPLPPSSRSFQKPLRSGTPAQPGSRASGGAPRFGASAESRPTVPTPRVRNPRRVAQEVQMQTRPVRAVEVPIEPVEEAQANENTGPDAEDVDDREL